MYVEYDLDGNGVLKTTISPISGGFSINVKVIPKNWISDDGKSDWPCDSDIGFPFICA